MTRPEYDFVCIGGGTAGLSGARTANTLGAKTLLINDGPPGGDCTFWGCVPSKTLIEAAHQGEDFGLAMERVKSTVDRIAATEDFKTLREEGIDVMEGRAKFNDSRTLDVNGTEIRSKKFLVAAGSKPNTNVLGLREADFYPQGPVHTNETIFNIEKKPKSLAILGGGAIGCELAQAFVKLGVEVSLFEAADRLLPQEESEASEVAAQVLRQDGVKLTLDANIKKLSIQPQAGQAESSVSLEDADAQIHTASNLLIAVGRSAGTQGLNLEAAGIKTQPNGAIWVKPTLKTSNSKVYAAGDVVGGPAFTHAADTMGRVAGFNALKAAVRLKFEPQFIASVVYTKPEIASIGIKESEADKKCRLAYLPMEKDDRARVSGEIMGYVRLISKPRTLSRFALGGSLVGATIVSMRAGEIINEVGLAMKSNLSVFRIATFPHSYPSWSVGLQKAAGQFFREVEGHKYYEI